VQSFPISAGAGEERAKTGVDATGRRAKTAPFDRQI
jgi:hypothetical protein